MTSLRGAALSVALLVVALLGAHAVAWWRAERVRAAWERDFGPWEGVVLRYPAREANATALRLEDLAAELGLDVAPSGAPDRPRPTDGARARLRAVREEVKPWLVAVLRAPAREVASPPASWTTFSAAHAATLDGLRGLLATGDVPIWERGSLARLEPDPWQWNGRHLAAGFRLQELLVADALAATASGDRERALASLEAAWTHARSLEEIPSLVADLQWVSCRVEQVGALRLVGGPAPGWDERLRLDGERQRFLDVAAIASRRPLETRAMRRAAVVAEDSGPFDRLPASPLLPIVRWLETDWSDAPRRFHVAIRPERARCLPVSEESLLVRLGDVHLSSPLSIVLPNLVNAAERFESLARHAALTRRVLALDRVRAATGRWPGELPAVEVDDCPDLRWRCETRADGSVLLALDPELDWSERHVRVLLPERVELGTDGG